MFQNGMTWQAHRVEAPRRPFSRQKQLVTEEPPSHWHDQTSGSSLAGLCSQTVSLKASSTSTSTGRPALSREPSNQLSQSIHTPISLPPLKSDGSRLATSSTMESRRSSRPRTARDPPPLFQAYPQALRLALLDSPSSSVESILRRQALSTSGDSTSPTALDEVTISHKKKKKSNRKRLLSMDSAWERKLYILVTSGYVLQYAADGHHDRLPEKILPLGHNSVAFASDAISGRPYVLQISRDSEQDEQRVDTNTTNIWSRIGFRTAQEKRMAESFLLVCESPLDLDEWMVAVRREIEAHGGAPYRCNCPRGEYEESIAAHDLSEQSQTGHEMQRFNESRPIHFGSDDSDHFPDKVNAKYEPLPEIETVSGPWSDRTFFPRPSSEDSSVNTATELDDLRESSQCSSSTATGHRLSLDESNTSLSPAEEKFTEAQIVSTRSNETSLIHEKGSPVWEEANVSGSRTCLSSEQDPGADSEQLGLGAARPVSVVPNFSLPNLSQRYSRCSAMLSDTSSSAMSEVLDMVDSEGNFKTESDEETSPTRPISTIAPLPSRETLLRNAKSRSPSGEYLSRRSSLTATTLIVNSRPLAQQNITDSKAASVAPATAGSVSTKRHSSCDILKSSLESSQAEHDISEHSTAMSHKHSCSTSRHEVPTHLLTLPVPQRMRRPASMQIHLISSLEIEMPERSPAVTASHFATNFGTVNPFDRSSSSLRETHTSSVPQLEVLSSVLQRATRPIRGKAASGSTIIGPPAGPPPTCALPAPPLVQIHDSSLPPSMPSNRRIFLDLTLGD